MENTFESQKIREMWFLNKNAHYIKFNRYYLMNIEILENFTRIHRPISQTLSSQPQKWGTGKGSKWFL